MPGSFDGLRRKFSRELKHDAERPTLIEISYRRRCLWVDDHPIKMRVKALAVLHFLLDCNALKKTSFEQEKAAKIMKEKWLPQANIPLGTKPLDITGREISHELSHLRGSLKKAGVTWQIPTRTLLLPPFALRLREE